MIACLITTVAAAPPPYAIERTSPAGSVVLADVVTMTATTTNSQVNQVEFVWYAPDGSVVETHVDSTPADGFTSDFTVDKVGTWTITARFCRVEDGVSKPIVWSPLSYFVDADPKTFFVVPEYPLIGAAGIALPMALALLVFKRKQLTNP